MIGKSNFIIITQPRSGSYFLQSLLDSADDIVCHGEIFKKERVEIGKWHSKRLRIEEQDIAKRDSDAYGFVMGLRNLNPRKIFGFKAFWPHIIPHKILIKNIVNNSEWKKIFLYRNPLETYASLLRAKETQQWVQKISARKEARGKAEFVRVKFEEASFIRHLREFNAFLNKNSRIISTQPECCFPVPYHEVLQQERQADILRFLGSSAPVGTLQSAYKKQFEGGLNEAFINKGDVLAFLRKQGTEAMLHDRCDLRTLFVKENI